MAIVTPACSAVADPAGGPGDRNGVAFDEYMSTIEHLADQINGAGGNPSGLSEQEIHDQLTAATNRLRDARPAG